MFTCPDCGVTYEVNWNRHPLFTQITFCPFCGYEYKPGEVKKLCDKYEYPSPDEELRT